MTVKLKNVSGEVRFLGNPNAPGTDPRVDVGEVVEVEGDLAPKKDQAEDASIVKVGDELRAYPTATWALVTTKGS